MVAGSTNLSSQLELQIQSQLHRWEHCDAPARTLLFEVALDLAFEAFRVARTIYGADNSTLLAKSLLDRSADLHERGMTCMC